MIKPILTWVTTTQGTSGSTLRHGKQIMWDENRNRITIALSLGAEYHGAQGVKSLVLNAKS